MKNKGIFMTNEILTDSNLSPTDKILLAYILSFKNGFYQQNDELAKIFQLSEKHISKIICKLSKLKYIDVKYNYQKTRFINRKNDTYKPQICDHKPQICDHKPQICDNSTLDLDIKNNININKLENKKENNNDIFLFLFKNFYKIKKSIDYCEQDEDKYIANDIHTKIIDTFKNYPDRIIIQSFLHNLPQWYIDNALTIKAINKNFTQIISAAADNINKSLKINYIQFLQNEITALNIDLQDVKIILKDDIIFINITNKNQYEMLENQYIKNLKKLVGNRQVKYNLINF